MKKLKKMLLILLSIMVIMAFTACSKKTKDKPKEQSKSTEKTKKQDTKEIKSNSGTISEDLYSYEILINGVSYSFPTSFSTFEKNGWIGEDFNNVKLEPNQYTIKNIKNGDQTIMVKIANFDMDVLPLSKCYIGGIRIGSDIKNQGTTISIAKGITIGSTYDQVIAAYGKPSNEYKGSTLTKLTYKSDTYSNYDIEFDTKTKKVDSIEIKNLVQPSQTKNKSVNTSLPKVVKNYKVPSKLGEELFSFEVKYGEKYYKLPVPIVELEKNGWVIQTDSDKAVPAKSSIVGVKLRKDNQILRTQIRNYSDNAEPLKHCFITYMEYYNNGAQIHLELPKGISEKSSINEVMAAYGQPTRTEESSNFKYYEYGEVFKKVTFVTKDNKIEKIEVNYSPKSLD